MKKADKSKTPFTPGDELPEFDPNRDSYVTVPSEIQALTPELQRHIMNKTSVKSIGKEFKANLEYLSRSAKINNKDYKYYLLNKEGTRIRSGWEYLEDAKDAKKDDPESGKILQRKGLKDLGIDPDVDDFWKV